MSAFIVVKETLMLCSVSPSNQSSLSMDFHVTVWLRQESTAMFCDG